MTKESSRQEAEGRKQEYVELHARSAFSFLQGAATPEELIAVCAELKMPSMALLDRDGVYGAARFHLAGKKLGIKAHIGAEITVRLNSARSASMSVEGAADNSPRRKPGERIQKFNQALEEGGREMSGNFSVSGKNSVAPNGAHHSSSGHVPRADARGYYLPPANAGSLSRIFTIPLLVHSRAGYQNLCRLITLMKLRVPKHAKPGECAVTPDELAEHAAGLICLTGGSDGPLRFNHHGDTEKAQRTTEWLIDVFGKGNVYAELQRHFNREEEARNHAVIEIARRLKSPLLATNGVSYATRGQRQVADVFTCIRNHVRST
jgi:error-prone DNA polymerase